MDETKSQLRRRMAELKRACPPEEMDRQSAALWARIEAHPAFRQAGTVLLYHSLPDEVRTHAFVDKWSAEKRILLPVVEGGRLELRRYTGRGCLRRGSYGIAEPEGEPVSDYGEISLAIIPGVAFDRQGNRLGRGKGYYDRLLPLLSAYTIGVCFSFQLVESLPAEGHDRPMDEVMAAKPALPIG